MRPAFAVLFVVVLLGMIGVAMGGPQPRFERSLPAHAPHQTSLGNGPIDT